ncbi:MAG: hypothetical protein ACI9CB_000576 [Rhodothermales bacterium]|jgi:hypothetical protein
MSDNCLASIRNRVETGVRPALFVQMTSHRFVALFLLAWVTAGSNTIAAQEEDQITGDYAAPRYLKTLVNPSSEELLEAARIVVRQPHGMGGLGRAEPGWKVHVFLPYNQDMDVFKAIQQAWKEERNVQAVPVQPWEASGETKEAFESRLKENDALLHGNEAYKEIGMFDPGYYPYLSKETQEKFGKTMGMIEVLSGFEEYLDKHTEVEHLVRDPAGASGWFCVYAPNHCDKHIANWTYINAIDVMNHSSEYPADVWSLVEETTAKPVEYVSEGTLVDPEGTDIHWEVSRELAWKWSQYANLPIANNHMFLYPHSMDTTVMEGVVAGCSNHTGFMPCMKVYLSKHGRVDKVVGGGKTGDYFRELISHPKFSPETVCYPNLPECGYWFLSGDGLGTNPKKVRNMNTLIQGQTDTPNLWERERAGVQHLSFTGASGMLDFKRSAVEQAVKDGKDNVGIFRTDPALLMYAFENELPTGHTSHIHNYFATIKWKLRDTGEWITISEKGRPSAFDNPEIRALASKYGDPDTIFSYDWIPAIPGVNVKGNYKQDYADDPWAWVSKEWEQIKDGTYEFFVAGYSMFER